MSSYFSHPEMQAQAQILFENKKRSQHFDHVMPEKRPKIAKLDSKRRAPRKTYSLEELRQKIPDYDKISPQEQTLQIQRLRNREAAARSRRRKQEQLEELQQEVNRLVGENTMLYDRITSLETGDSTERVNSLETQNVHLRRKVDSLSAELSKMKAQLAAKMEIDAQGVESTGFTNGTNLPPWLVSSLNPSLSPATINPINTSINPSINSSLTHLTLLQQAALGGLSDWNLLIQNFNQSMVGQSLATAQALNSNATGTDFTNGQLTMPGVKHEQQLLAQAHAQAQQQAAQQQAAQQQHAQINTNGQLSQDQRGLKLSPIGTESPPQKASSVSTTPNSQASSVQMTDVMSSSDPSITFLQGVQKHQQMAQRRFSRAQIMPQTPQQVSSISHPQPLPVQFDQFTAHNVAGVQTPSQHLQPQHSFKKHKSRQLTDSLTAMPVWDTNVNPDLGLPCMNVDSAFNFGLSNENLPYQ